MLIILEKDKNLRKKLCDLLDRERIINCESPTDLLEMLCKFRNQIKVVISRIGFLPGLHAKKLIERICEKLLIEIPAVVGFYTKADRAVMTELEGLGAGFPLVELDEGDPGFPERYITLLVGVYPELIHDLNRARECWQKKPEPPVKDFVDLREWLTEEGFGDVIERIVSKEKSLEQVIPSIEELLKEEVNPATPAEDYQKLYLEMKEKYEQLARYVQELIDFVKKI
jgi:hypothetical protein